MDTTDQPMNRRSLLLTTGGLAVAALASRASAAETTKADAPKDQAQKPREYTLPPLPYAKNALDGYLSAEILELHHDKHHAAYVTGLNKALADLDEARKSGNFAAIKGIERNLAFHGSGHVLHSIYWNSMSPTGGGAPKDGLLKSLLERDFGSVDLFRKHFAEATKNAEASAWGVLAWEPMGQRLVVLAAEDHQNMGLQGSTPLLVCDVWEHAYYLRYRSNRAEYVDKFFDVVNWTGAEERLRKLSAA